MAGKKTTEADAKNILEACKAAPADILFVDERPAKLQAAVAKGMSSKDMEKEVGIPKNVASCAAIAYGIETPGVMEKLSAWTGKLTAGFTNVAEGLSTSVNDKVNDMAIKPYQGATSVDRANRTLAPDAKI
jgi:hypothetical protein